ncbi:MAG: hypothetical protein R3A10_18700 [Caldilineaceae bacterium]
MTLRVDMAVFPAGPHSDLLIIHHHNVAAHRVELVPVEVSGPRRSIFRSSPAR